MKWRQCENGYDELVAIDGRLLGWVRYHHLTPDTTCEILGQKWSQCAYSLGFVKSWMETQAVKLCPQNLQSQAR